MSLFDTLIITKEEKEWLKAEESKKDKKGTTLSTDNHDDSSNASLCSNTRKSRANLDE
jgi:hypothetical protein